MILYVGGLLRIKCESIMEGGGGYIGITYGVYLVGYNSFGIRGVCFSCVKQGCIKEGYTNYS